MKISNNQVDRQHLEGLHCKGTFDLDQYRVYNLEDNFDEMEILSRDILDQYQHFFCSQEDNFDVVETLNKDILDLSLHIGHNQVDMQHLEDHHYRDTEAGCLVLTRLHKTQCVVFRVLERRWGFLKCLSSSFARSG